MLFRDANPDSPATTVPVDYAKENTTPFVDVQGGQYYTAAINWAYEQGIFTGDAVVATPTVRPGDNM
jgi:hypothetical protein